MKKETQTPTFKSIIRWIAKAQAVKRMPGGHINMKSGNVLRMPATLGVMEDAVRAANTVLGTGRRARVSTSGSDVVVWCAR